jgi:trimethylamine--corrinoid protein Co-methyltransferase
LTSARYSRLGQRECQRVHEASLEILDRVGIEVHDQRARELLIKGGATADGIRIRLSERMVEGALGATPRRLTLFDRRGEVAIRAEGHNAYFGGGSDCLHILDHRSGDRRRATLEDVKQAVILQDALPEVDFVMSAALPADVDQKIYDRYQMEVMLNRTTKPIVFATPDFEGCVTAVEMCEVVAGGAEVFRERPFATCYINITSGLVANTEALEKCMYLAEKGLPLLWIPLNAGGVNSPVTAAGCMASMNAGTLLGVTLAQLVREGTPVAVPGWNGGPYNLQTMVGNYVLADEQGLAPSMGRFYDLPVFGLAGSTDAKILDQQCGAEAVFSLVFACLNGANINHDLGFMDAGLQYSFQLLVTCNEHLGFLRAATAGVPVDEDSLAVGVVEELGPTGDYLTHDHTLKYMRRAYHSKLVDKRRYSQWRERGGKSMEDLAAEKIDELLEAHRPDPLAPDLQASLRKIVEKAQAWSDSRS